jgi:hypothetical protein
VSVNIKDKVLLMPPCPTCRATMDLKCLESFGSRHTSDDGKLYYCNNPMCPPDEEEGKERVLIATPPFQRPITTQ